MLEKAIEKPEMKNLSDILYKAKLINLCENKDRKALNEAIFKAEKTLVTLSSMSWQNEKFFKLMWNESK